MVARSTKTANLAMINLSENELVKEDLLVKLDVSIRLVEAIEMEDDSLFERVKAGDSS